MPSCNPQIPSKVGTGFPESKNPLVIGLVIPCYRENWRLPGFLPGLLTELSKSGFEARVQVVDDGSGEEEAGVLEKYVETQRADHGDLLFPLLKLPENLGKGGAIMAGWRTFGEGVSWLGFVDADGAVPPGEVTRLIALALEAADPNRAYFASRCLGRGVERAFLREVLAGAFRMLTRLMVRLPVKDTQCGLKLVSYKAYDRIAPLLRRNDFAFDIEFALRLQEDGRELVEVPIRWKEQAGSHVKPRHLVAMAVAVLGYGIARWRRKLSA